MLGGLGPLVPVSSTEGEGGDTAAADAGAEAVEVADDNVVLAPSGKDKQPTQPTLDRGGRPHGTLAVLSYGTRRWSLTAAQLHGRTGKHKLCFLSSLPSARWRRHTIAPRRPPQCHGSA